jgi:protein-disulfide isomerase
MHDWLFANARSLSRPDIEEQAIALGLDPRRLAADVDGGWIAARVIADKDFASTKGVNSTPTMYINGRQVRGAQQREQIEALVREEIVLAQRLLAAGSPRREIWARFMAASSSEPAPVPVPVFAPAPGRDPNKRYTVPLTGLTARGAKQPKVEILMCGDFDCPYSKRATATLEDLLKRYPKQLAVYFRHQPLTAIHKDAMAAHRAAVAADNQGKFWAMFEALYAEPAQRSAAELEELAKQAGLKLTQFRKDIADAKTDELIRKHIEVCEQQLDNRGTPGFFINGRPLTGAQPITAFEAIIDEELAAAP